MSLALFGDLDGLSAVSPDKLLAQSQRQLDKLQAKANPTVADKAKIAGLFAQIQVLNSGGTTADAKKAFREVQTKTKEDAKPPIIPPLPGIPDAPETDLKPWIYGGIAVVAGLGLLAFLMRGKKE